MTNFPRLAVLSVAVALVLVSCTTRKIENASAPEKIALPETSMNIFPVTSSASATVANSYQEPKWTNAPSSYDDAEYMYFSGSSDVTFSDRIARQLAMTDAASSFAKWWEQSVNSVITTYSNIEETGSKRDYYTFFEESSKTSASTVVSGLEAVDYWENPQTGDLWILTRISKKLIGKTLQNILDEASTLNEFSTDEEGGTVADALKNSFEELLQQKNGLDSEQM